MLKLQYRWTLIVFSKKTDLPPKSASRSADCSCDNPERKFPTKDLLDQTPKKCAKFEKNRKTFQKCFSTKTSTDTWYIDCGFRQSDEIFSLKVKSCSESEKNSDFFSFENGFPINGSLGRLLLFFQPWKMFFAILPKISKNIQKSSIFAGFLS